MANIPALVENIRYQGIECVRLRSEGASVIASRFGAQVLSWAPADGRERLFLSDRAIYDGRSAIRGGVPICFPQFSGLGSLPKHGFLRTRDWHLEGAREGGKAIAFRCASNAETHAIWAHEFEARLVLELSSTALAMRFSVRNTGNSAFLFTGALHTYFSVSSIDEVALSGLKGCEYRDAAGGNAIRVEQEEVVRFGPEIDRVYHDAPRKVLLQDGAGTTAVASSGFADTVVWNPGAALCVQMADMAPHGYQQMVCVEAAVARVPVSVLPGDTWTGNQTLTVKGASHG
jgi:glucose-6-phosphate 1-epimerase